MFFFFKKKKIVVDCFTADATVYNLWFPEPAVNYFPDWWKTLDPYTEIVTKVGLQKIGTIKKCNGFIDLYKTGFILPLWSELVIKTDNLGQIFHEFSDPTHTAETHPQTQYNTREFDKYIHLKLLSPWLFKEKTGVQFSWTEPIWNNISKLTEKHILPANVNYKYQHGTNVNILFPRRDKQIRLNAGDPLVHILPLTEHEIEIKTHLVTGEELHKLGWTSQPSSFTNKYRVNKKRIDELEKRKGKCPFGFGK